LEEKVEVSAVPFRGCRLIVFRFAKGRVRYSKPFVEQKATIRRQLSIEAEILKINVGTGPPGQGKAATRAVEPFCGSSRGRRLRVIDNLAKFRVD
jgi:hypothetical protein